MSTLEDEEKGIASKDLESEIKKLEEEELAPSVSKPTHPQEVKAESKRWTIFDPFNRIPASPPPRSLDDAEEIPLATASFVNKLFFQWMQPLLVKGYRRPLQAEDLWKMDHAREAATMADIFEKSFARRKKEVEEWNESLKNGTFKPGRMRRAWWKVWNKTTGFGSADGTRKIGIAMALSDTYFWEFWSAGLFKIVADLAQVCSPLLLRQLIYFVTDSALFKNNTPGVANPSVGKGVGLAIGLLLLQIIFSICTAQTLSRSAQVGVLARSALIAAVYRRAMVLSGRSRVLITNSKLVNHISTDISRIDFASFLFHFSYTCVIQLIEVIIILLTQIGVSALPGLALVFLCMPIQFKAVSVLYGLRRKSMKYTDARIKLISELLTGIRVLKYFAWEGPYLEKVSEYRRKELVGIRALLNLRAGTQALAISIPTLSSILVFVTYSLTGHAQNPALIWTALSLINLLRMPLMLLPSSLSTVVDAKNAMDRLVSVFTCETLEEHFEIDPSAKYGLQVDHGNFVWEQSSPPAEQQKKSSKKVKVVEKEVVEKRAPSELHDITLRIPRGELWIICGSIGSGKSSLLQGLIGEMRRTSGEVVFGGTVSYCAQQPWIQNATVRDNILFGQPFDEQRYWQCVRDSCLLPDLEMLPQGDMTEIGEKGIALSGGQRQRVSICRTLYFSADVVLLDDILSALDAHVGKYVMENVVLGALANKTRLLATHAIHFMSSADRIICLDKGRITEEGTYDELLKAGGVFSRLSKEYGGVREDKTDAKESEEAPDAEQENKSEVKKSVAIMQAEERNTGGIAGKVYLDYLRAAKGYLTVPLLLLSLVVMQGSQGVSQFELTWWQEDLWKQSDAFYMGLYAALGVVAAIFTFISGSVVVYLGSLASRTLHREALHGILAAPMSFFDTTPMGRALNRFTKDIDAIDNRMIDSLRMVLVTVAGILGAFIIVAIVQPWFLIGVAATFVAYVYLSHFYGKSAREIKRLDNLLRSNLYGHFSESLSGLATVRAFGETKRFIKNNEHYLDLENRAYLLTVINQRWLGIRIDFFGTALTFVVAMIAVGQRFTISPSMIGLVLSSILSIQQTLSTLIRQYAEVDNNLASVERMQHYSSGLEQEAPREIPGNSPPTDWPSQGVVEFKNATMSYRPGLPASIVDISVQIRPGEKVGVIGRTGAGKSSLMVCLFRFVELSAGSIVIDGIDISKLGLKDLRTKIAIIPQDALLFNGTLRTNLDPFNLSEDAVLWDALKRSSLVNELAKADGTGVTDSENRFNLDTPIEDEGLNMSVGERSLVSLARALVKDSKIVILDECTANVDMDTDAKIQHTIATEFKDKTLLCIAHRLKTIIGYDRILVMDQGRVAAFDTPEILFKQGGIFESLCAQSGINLQEIERAQFRTRSLPA